MEKIEQKYLLFFQYVSIIIVHYVVLCKFVLDANLKNGKGHENMITTNAFDYINVMDKALDASWLRESALANNVANMDTPGYKRQDVDFESALKKELGNTKYVSLDQKIRGLNTDLSGLDVSTYTDSASYSYRLDGNNVDPDTEPVELASEELRYELLSRAVTDEFTRIQTVLK